MILRIKTRAQKGAHQCPLLCPSRGKITEAFYYVASVVSTHHNLSPLPQPVSIERGLRLWWVGIVEQ